MPAATTLIVAYGMGVDSTAMLVGLQQRGERPDLILFADTGDEKAATYAYLPVINAWLDSVNFPRVTVVKNARPISGDKSLSDSCMRLGVLPALAYGQHQCSLVWKRDPQQKFVRAWEPAIKAWQRGETVTQCIGYDAGPRDSCRSYKAEGKASPGYTNRFPLIEWGWDRERCVAEIEAAGLPVPMKSACFHCPASKQHEIVWLKANAPEQFTKALAMEALARPKIEARKAEGKRVSTKGLGRNFAWADYHGVEVKKGHAIVYKGVDDDYSTDHARCDGIYYKPGAEVKAASWNTTTECGNGLHFSPRPVMTLEFNRRAKRFLKCRIKLTEARTPKSGDSYPHKIKAKRCEVIAEVDKHGRPV